MWIHVMCFHHQLTTTPSQDTGALTKLGVIFFRVPQGACVSGWSRIVPQSHDVHVIHHSVVNRWPSPGVHHSRFGACGLCLSAGLGWSGPLLGQVTWFSGQSSSSVAWTWVWMSSIRWVQEVWAVIDDLFCSRAIHLLWGKCFLWLAIGTQLVPLLQHGCVGPVVQTECNAVQQTSSLCLAHRPGVWSDTE